MSLVCFVRRAQDIDHATPFLWQWLKCEAGRLQVVVIGDRQLAADYRLQFLARHDCCASISHVDDLIPEWVRHKRRVGMTLRRGIPSIRFRRKRLGIPQAGISALFDRLTTQDEPCQTSLFPWVSDNDPVLDFYDKALHECARRNLVTVAFPHGDQPHWSRLNSVNAIEWAQTQNYCYTNASKFDYVIAPNEPCAERFKVAVKPEKLLVLGSARFSEKWITEGVPQLRECKTDMTRSERLIVMFLRNYSYPIYWDEVCRTVELLSRVKDCEVVVQHHTTADSYPQLAARYPFLEIGCRNNVIIDGSSLPSAQLVRRAAVVVDLGTSIVFEAVRLGKPIISPEYLHATKTTISHYMPSSVVLCRDELVSGVDAVMQNRGIPNYSDADRQRFISQMLDGGDQNVLERYVEFLDNCNTLQRSAA